MSTVEIMTHCWKISFDLPTFGGAVGTVYINAPTAADALVMLNVIADAYSVQAPRHIEWVPPGSVHSDRIRSDADSPKETV